MSLLDVGGLTKVYGDGCPSCIASTGPANDRNQCPECGSVVACAEVSFDVRDGDVLGIVGESGSGKSSVAETIALEAPATDGRVGLRDRGDVLDADYQRRRELRDEHLGMVHQQVRDGLDESFTGGGNVAEKLLSAGWRNYEEIRERVRELFEETEIPAGRIDDATETYSGGMQRRVQIARAIANDPELVVLDEPTTGLDVSVQARVLDTFRRLQREQDVATVVVSHDLGVVRLLADRVLVMRQGRVVESGLTDRVMEDPHHEYTQTLINSII